jgi:hypothetical protein
MPAIPNPFPVAHPAQPGVTLDALALETLSLTRGSAIDAPARLAFALRPYAEAGDGYIAAPLTDLPPTEVVIEDVYAWVAARLAAGDAGPAQAIQALVQQVGAEYARRTAGG